MKVFLTIFQQKIETQDNNAKIYSESAINFPASVGVKFNYFQKSGVNGANATAGVVRDPKFAQKWILKDNLPGQLQKLRLAKDRPWVLNR